MCHVVLVIAWLFQQPKHTRISHSGFKADIRWIPEIMFCSILMCIDQKTYTLYHVLYTTIGSFGALYSFLL